MLGGAAGTVALPVLKAPGTFGGFGGAIVAAGSGGRQPPLQDVQVLHKTLNKIARSQALESGSSPC